MPVVFESDESAAGAGQNRGGNAEFSRSDGEKSSRQMVSKNGKLRYRYANKKYAKSGFTKIHGSWYCFDKNGNLQTGWKTIGSKRFYFEKKGEPGEKGKLVTGWKKIGKKSTISEKVEKREPLVPPTRVNGRH